MWVGLDKQTYEFHLWSSTTCMYGISSIKVSETKYQFLHTILQCHTPFWWLDHYRRCLARLPLSSEFQVCHSGENHVAPIELGRVFAFHSKVGPLESSNLLLAMSTVCRAYFPASALGNVCFFKSWGLEMVMLQFDSKVLCIEREGSVMAKFSPMR